MKVTIIGTGRVGKAVGHGLQKAGHEVTFGSRSPGVVPELGDVSLGLADSVVDANVIVNAVPGAVALETLQAIGAPALEGKILVDVGNALNSNFELIYPNASLAEAIQNEFPGTAVVKTLNTVSSPLMANPGTIAPTTVFLSGNDETAKATVASLLGDLGWPTQSRMDLGDISTAHAPEHYIFLSMAVARVVKTTRYGIAVERESGSATRP